jgi:hypothetical protein
LGKAAGVERLAGTVPPLVDIGRGAKTAGAGANPGGKLDADGWDTVDVPAG